MKLTKADVARLKSFYKSNLVPIFLTKIEWSSKQIAGQIDSCYAYTATPNLSCKMPHGLVGSIDVGQSTDVNGRFTIWMREMTSDLHDIYVDEGLTEMKFDLDSSSVVEKTPKDTQTTSESIQPGV